MTKKKSPWTRRVKAAWASANRGIQRLLGKVKEKVDLDSHFTQMAQKWDRISTGMVNLDPTFLGIFDPIALTLTFRAEGSLEKGGLVESEHLQYRIEEIRPEQVQVPVDIEKVTHLIPCRVAVLVRI